MLTWRPLSVESEGGSPYSKERQTLLQTSRINRNIYACISMRLHTIRYVHVYKPIIKMSCIKLKAFFVFSQQIFKHSLDPFPVVSLQTQQTRFSAKQRGTQHWVFSSCMCEVWWPGGLRAIAPRCRNTVDMCPDGSHTSALAHIWTQEATVNCCFVTERLRPAQWTV
jgi:hypothetical protein